MAAPEDVSAAATRWRLVRIALGYGIALAAIVFTLQRLDLAAADLWLPASSLGRWSVAGAFALFTLHALMNAMAFGYLLRSFEPRSSLTATAASWSASVLAKYVPGGVWQIVGRGVLLHRMGITPGVSMRSGLVEQALSLAGCLAVFLLASRFTGQGPYAGFWMAGLMLLLATFLVPRSLLKQLGIGHRGPYSVSAAIYLAALVPYGAAYLLVVAPASSLPFVQGLFEGTVAGVLAVFAPGGLGIRESWVVLNQTQAAGQSVLASMVFARFIIVASEVIVCLAGTAWLSMTAGSRPGQPGHSP